MRKKLAHRTTAPCCIESLENRNLLSAAGGPIRHADVLTPSTHTTIIAAPHVAKLGQNIRVTVIVSALPRFGAPAGTVEFLDNGNLIQASGGPIILTLSARHRASYTFGPGNIGLYLGKHQITAEFISGNALPDSTSHATRITVTLPRFKGASDGLEAATVKPGHGKAIAAGQTAAVAETDFLASNGSIFDYAADYQFAIGEGQVITGFDQGTFGMKIGETRVLFVPSALGYGSNGASPSIPADANLVFFVTLLSIT